MRQYFLILCIFFTLPLKAKIPSQAPIHNPMTPFKHHVVVSYPLEKRHRWVNARHIPSNAIIAGWYPNKNLFVCRAIHKGIRHAGALSNNTCYLAIEDQVFKKNRYEILTGNGLSWQDASNGYVPQSAIKVNHHLGLATFVCQAQYDQFWYPGEIYGQSCVIPVLGHAMPMNRYKVLQSALEDPRQSNRIVYHSRLDD